MLNAANSWHICNCVQSKQTAKTWSDNAGSNISVRQPCEFLTHGLLVQHATVMLPKQSEFLTWNSKIYWSSQKLYAAPSIFWDWHEAGGTNRWVSDQQGFAFEEQSLKHWSLSSDKNVRGRDLFLSICWASSYLRHGAWLVKRNSIEAETFRETSSDWCNSLAMPLLRFRSANTTDYYLEWFWIARPLNCQAVFALLRTESHCESLQSLRLGELVFEQLHREPRWSLDCNRQTPSTAV